MKPERSVPGWHRLEPEVQHYFEHEEGAAALNWEPKTSSGSPRAPQFAPDADYYLMFTAVERLREADQIMPFEPAKYKLADPPLGKSGAVPTQTRVKVEKPSCSMVLRSEFGNNKIAMRNKFRKYDAEFMLKARQAYVEAAKRVPAKRRDPARARRGMEARLDRMLRGEKTQVED